ncbi:CD109 antigen-like [Chironomus tepperi]|uniref:CD109 antigen-like n=1 Tax=Chironomus tepperi TaxID=113505 RepID=UPI00391F7BBE
MKLVLKFVIAFAVHTVMIRSEQITLIGSHLLSPDSSYRTFLSANNLRSGSNVDVSLLASNRPTTKNVRISNEDTFEQMQFEDVPQSNEYKLKVASRSSNKCSSVKLIKSSDRPLILIQFSKLFYSTSESFSFRIFALNQKLLPYKGTQSINVKILDSKNEAVQIFDRIPTTNFGVYENSFKLESAQNVGQWKIQVESGDKKITKKFHVGQPSDDNLEMYIQMSPAISYTDRRAYMDIYVKDKNNKIFTGTANIYASGKFKGSDRNAFDRKLVKQVELAGHKNIVDIKYDEHLGIYPSANMILRFDVEATDPDTQRSIKTSKEVELKYNTRNTIHLIRKKYFKPGFKFPMKVKVKTLNGQPDNSFNQLYMTVEYHNNGTGIVKKQFQLNLKDGEILTPVEPTLATTQITLNYEFAGAKLTEVIEPLPVMGEKEYMQVTPLKKSTVIGQKIKYQAQTTGEMESLHVLLIGINGIVHYEEFPDAVTRDLYEFTVELTEEMRPESRGIVFYVRRSDGVLIYDDFVLNLGYGIENMLEISVPEVGKPNELINIDIKTTKGSKVFLTAADQLSPQLIRDNEISKMDIYNELIYYLNYRFPNTSLYHFEKFNGFVLQPEEGTCGSEMAGYEPDEFDEASTDVDYFPKVWFDKSIDVASDDSSITLNLPKPFATWRYYGLSMHPTKGLAVVKSQPKTTVKNEIVVMTKAPQYAYKGEIFWVDVNVFNNLQDSLQAGVSISLENAIFVDKNIIRSFNYECTKFIQSSNKYDIQKSITLQPQKKTFVDRIPIKSNGIGDIKIKVTADAGSYKDEASKSIHLLTSEPFNPNGNFDIKVQTQKYRDNEVRIDIESKQLLDRQSQPDTTVSIMVQLPRGFRYVSHDQNDKIQDYKFEQDPIAVVFYLRNIGRQGFKLGVIGSKVYDVDNHSPSLVQIYDYDRLVIKESSYYTYDINSWACNKIEVLEGKSLVERERQKIQGYQKSVQNSTNEVTQAKQQLEKAGKTLEKAKENVGSAQENAIDAEKKSEDALNVLSSAENEWKTEYEAQQSQDETIVEESAGREPANAAQAQNDVDAANMERNDAQRKFDDVRSKFDKAERNLNAAKRIAQKSKDDANQLRWDAEDAKTNATKAQNKLEETHKSINNTLNSVNEAEIEINKIQDDVKEALVFVKNVIKKANAASKYTEIKDEVVEAQNKANDVKIQAEDAYNSKTTAVKDVKRFVNYINGLLYDSQQFEAHCNQLSEQATSVNNTAMKIKTTVDSYKNLQIKFANAQQELKKAEAKLQSAQDKLSELQTTTQRPTTTRPSPRTYSQRTLTTTTRQSLQKTEKDETSTTTQRTTSPTAATTTTSPTMTNDQILYTTDQQEQSTNSDIKDNASSKVTTESGDCSKWFRFCDFGL